MKKTYLTLAALLAAGTYPATIQAQNAGPAPAPTTTTADDGANIRAATEAYNRGVAALNKNQLPEAATEFERAVELSPADASAQMFLGYVRLRQENYAAALTALEAARAQVSRLDEKLRPVLYNNLGIAYANSDRANDALAAYQQALQLSGAEEYTDARFNLAFALLAQKKVKEAIPHLLKLRDERTTDRAFQSSVFDGLAEAYEADGNWPQALAAYRRVTELNPTDPTARFNFALALSKTGRVDDAITQGREVLKVRVNHEPTLLLLGDLYSRKQNWREAKDVLGRYVIAKPDEFSAWFSLAVAQDYSAEFDNALQSYAKAEALAPQDPAVKNNIGRIHFKRGEVDPKMYDQAVIKLQEALALDPQFEDARINLALVYTAQENWEPGIEQWKSYLDGVRLAMQRPGLSAADRTAMRTRALSARGALAEIYLKSGAYANAVSEYRMILGETPANLDAMSNLGLALYHIRNYEEATRTYREVIRRDPKNAIAHNNLGVVLEARNQRAEAIASYQKALELKRDYAEAKANVERLTTAT